MIHSAEESPGDAASDQSNESDFTDMNSSAKVHCDVYKGDKKDDVYLYVDHDDGLDRVPEDLLQQLGEPTISISFILSEDRVLARQDSKRVLRNLVEHGYHLQLPALKKW